METTIFEESTKDVSLYDLWAKRTPYFETKYEDSVLRVISDYGVGASSLMNDKGKILGAGYEPFILAFFIGLYSDKKVRLSSQNKPLGQPFQYWGNLDSKKTRKAYPKLREYIFTALVARTPLNLLEIDKGNIKIARAVDQLMLTFNQYANYGFSVMEEKLKNDPGYFYKSTSFLDIFLQLTGPQISEEEDFDDEPEPLD